MIKKNMPIACSIAINRGAIKIDVGPDIVCSLARVTVYRSYDLRYVNESRLIAVATTLTELKYQLNQCYCSVSKIKVCCSVSITC